MVIKTTSALVVETVYLVLLPAYQFKMDIQQAINLERKRRFEAEGIDLASAGPLFCGGITVF